MRNLSWTIIIAVLGRSLTFSSDTGAGQLSRPPAENHEEDHYEGQCRREGASHHVVERAPLSRQGNNEQRNKSRKQNHKAAEKKKGALCFARHEFIVMRVSGETGC